MEYTFTLRYLLPTHEQDHKELVKRLGAAGCDDALVGSGLPGRIALEFTREAPDAQEALASALRDVRQAIPEARLIEAGPDLVGLSDVAGMLGMSRQNLRKLMISHGPDFPPPLHEGSTSIWHLADLLAWLRQRDGYQLDDALVELSEILRQVNLAREAGKLAPRMLKEWRGLVE